MTSKYIVIDINSDLDPITYPINTDDEIEKAQKALRDAGLAWEDVYVGDPDCPDSYVTETKFFA